MSRDGLFFKAAGKLHPQWHTPVAALIVQALWTCVLCISGSYGQLLDYIIFTELVFYILTIAVPVCAAGEAAQRRAALPRHRLSRAARRLYSDGRLDLYRIIALQTPVHMAGPGDRAARRAGFPGVVPRSPAKSKAHPNPSLEEQPRMARLFATKALSACREEASAEGEHTLKRSLGAHQPDHAGHWRDHRRGHLRAHRNGGGAVRGSSHRAFVSWLPASVASSQVCATPSLPP